MREISASAISDAVAQLAMQACYQLPASTIQAFEYAQRNESSTLGREILGHLLDNAKLAAEGVFPICQDTGLAVIFADLGQEVHITGGDFIEAINSGIRKGYTDGYLRKSSVAEPLFERKNTSDNTPAIVHLRLVQGDKLHLLLAPKGAGSENKSVLKMLVPADGLEGVRRVVLDAVLAAGPNACPPFIVGVGLGGNMEEACLCAKRAAVRELGTSNSDPRYATLEREFLTMINQTGIGSQGLGGRITALAVNIEWLPTHIASLPVAININCNATRHAEITL